MREDTREVDQNSSVTELSPAEHAVGAVSRKVAFYVLAMLAVIACAGAVYFWYLWVVTARTCVDTYILRNTTSALLDPGKAKSLQDYLSGLDISSFSALILALLFTRLAIGGIRHTLLTRRRAGKGYFVHAYHRILFPEGFESLCIRLGLLGTLLSFLLAAISLMGVSGPTTDVGGTTLESQAAAVSREVTPGNETPDVITAPPNATSSTSQLSGQMFLLLCASLVSTFVGTGTSFVVTPSLNWLNDRAVGRHQIRQIDEESAAEDFFRQIDRTSQRLSDFDATTVKLAESAEHIAAFEANVADASERLTVLLAEHIASFGTNVADASERLAVSLKNYEQSIRLLKISNQNSQLLTEKLSSVEQLSDRLCQLLQHLPEELNTPLLHISAAAIRFRDAAREGQDAFAGFRKTASAAGDSLAKTEQRTQKNSQLLVEVRQALRELAGHEVMKTERLTRVADSFEQLSAMLGESSKEVESVLKHFAHRDSQDEEVVRSLAAIKAQLSQSFEARADEPVGPKSTSRAPWWRRLLG